MATNLQFKELPVEKTAMTDGFHLVIDALKANDIDTIFGLVGIPHHRPGSPGAGRRDAGDRISS